MLSTGVVPKKTVPIIASNFVDNITPYPNSPVAWQEMDVASMTVKGGTIRPGDVIKVHFKIDSKDNSWPFRLERFYLDGVLIFSFQHHSDRSYHQVIELIALDSTTLQTRGVFGVLTYSRYYNYQPRFNVTVDLSSDFTIDYTRAFENTAWGTADFRGMYVEHLRAA